MNQRSVALVSQTYSPDVADAVSCRVSLTVPGRRKVEYDIEFTYESRMVRAEGSTLASSLCLDLPRPYRVRT